jgi:predicted translin family RNA/ssDNA-binding protein
VTTELSEDSRDERRKAIEELKKKIKDFPELRWVIRQGAVTLIERFTARSSAEDSKLDKSLIFSINFVRTLNSVTDCND